jgi:hypothetical protein
MENYLEKGINLIAKSVCFSPFGIKKKENTISFKIFIGSSEDKLSQVMFLIKCLCFCNWQ